MAGWVKIKRSLLDWEWYDDHNATRLLLHLNLTVNFEDKKWKGILIKKGSMVISWNTLSESVGLSIKQCRTAMDKLISSKEVTKVSTNKFQVVTLVKWEKMQLENGVEGKQKADKGQSKGNQRATTKEGKEVKKERNNKTVDFLNFKKEIATQKIWAESWYMQHGLKNGSLSKLLDKFILNLNLKDISEQPKNIKDFKSHFVNWTNKQDQVGKLTEYAKYKSKVKGAL